MTLVTEPYAAQVARWPRAGRHILAQFTDDAVVVYQAYCPAIGHFAARHKFFGGAFSLNRMSWIKPKFLWMMYRSGWGTKEGEDIFDFVAEQRPMAQMGDHARLMTPREEAYPISDPEIAARIGVSD